MEQRTSIKFCVKLERTFTECLKCCGKLMRIKCYHEQQFTSGSRGLRKAENRWMTMSAVDGQRRVVRMNRWKKFEN